MSESLAEVTESDSIPREIGLTPDSTGHTTLDCRATRPDAQAPPAAPERRGLAKTGAAADLATLETRTANAEADRKAHRSPEHSSTEHDK